MNKSLRSMSLVFSLMVSQTLLVACTTDPQREEAKKEVPHQDDTQDPQNKQGTRLPDRSQNQNNEYVFSSSLWDGRILKKNSTDQQNLSISESDNTIDLGEWKLAGCSNLVETCQDGSAMEIQYTGGEIVRGTWINRSGNHELKKFEKRWFIHLTDIYQSLVKDDASPMTLHSKLALTLRDGREISQDIKIIFKSPLDSVQVQIVPSEKIPNQFDSLGKMNSSVQTFLAEKSNSHSLSPTIPISIARGTVKNLHGYPVTLLAQMIIKNPEPLRIRKLVVSGPTASGANPVSLRELRVHPNFRAIHDSAMVQMTIQPSHVHGDTATPMTPTQKSIAPRNTGNTVDAITDALTLNPESQHHFVFQTNYRSRNLALSHVENYYDRLYAGTEITGSIQILGKIKMKDRVLTRSWVFELNKFRQEIGDSGLLFLTEGMTNL